MFQETFEVKVKKGKKLPKRLYEEDEDEGSEIEDDDSLSCEGNDDDDNEFLEYLQKAFGEVADVSGKGTEYMLDFFETNAKLVEVNGNYDFEIVDDVPVLYDAIYFIPFVEFIKEFEPALTGITLNTNLEGGGHLVI